MASSVFRREKYLLTLSIVRIVDKRYAHLVFPESARQMLVTNLRNRPLSSSSIDSMDNLILSLYHNLVTGYKDFPYISVKGFFDSVQVTTPFAHAGHRENAIPSPLTDSPPGVMVPPAGSDFPPQILTPGLPEKADMSVAKADWRNCVRTLDIDGITVTRAISTIYHTEDIEMTNR